MIRLSDPTRPFTLARKYDEVFLRFADDEEISVRLLWVRPISGKGQEISFVDWKKKEVLMIAGLDQLDAESQTIAREELDKRYLVPRILRILNAQPRFGSYYHNVLTDRGPRQFVMKDPGRNITWLSPDRLILRDTLGNRFEIESLAALDPKSRYQFERVI